MFLTYSTEIFIDWCPNDAWCIEDEVKNRKAHEHEQHRDYRDP